MKIVQLLSLVSNPDIFFISQKKNDLDTKAQVYPNTYFVFYFGKF